MRAAVACCVAPLLVATAPAHAQSDSPKDKSKSAKPAVQVDERCSPTYVPKKGETPPTCPGVTEVPLQPAQGVARQAATPPPVKSRRARMRRKATEARAVINSPGFRMSRNGQSRIFVQIHGKPTVHQYVTRGGVTYVLSHARVPVHNNRHPLMTQYFNTPVADARLRQHRGDVLLRIDMRAPAAPTPRFVELVKDKVTMLEVTFPAGNYYRHIPRGPKRGIPGRRGPRDPHRSGSAPPGARGRRSPPPDSGSRSSVLGPPAP